MKITKENIMKFINSPDKENVYTIAVSLRKDAILTGESNSHLIKMIPVNNRVYTLEDIYDELGILEENVLVYKNASTSFERFINACAIIPKIVKVYNDGKIVDWDNSSQDKYLPYLEKTGAGWSFQGTYYWGDGADGPCAFYYVSRERAEQSCTKFLSTYIDYITYIG